VRQRLVTTDARFDMFLREFDHKDNAGRPVGLDTEAVGPARRYSQARANPFLNMGYAAIQGISIAFWNENVYYFPLRHKGPNAKWVWAERAVAELKEHPVWAHNVKFDAGLLEAEGFTLDCFWRDSMLAAWLAFSRSEGIGLKLLAKELLDRESPEWKGSLIDKTAEEVKDYVCHDALNTLQIGELLYHEKLTKKQQDALVTIETPFAIELSRMERDGIRLDIEKLEETMGALADAHMADALKKWDALDFTVTEEVGPNDDNEYETHTHPLNWGSAKDLQELFMDGTLEPQGETKTGAFKTGADVMKWNIKNGRPEQAQVAELILELRAASKVKGTYLDGFYEELRQWPDRRLHPELLQMGTRTGRLSSSNPNIQNQLSKGEYAPLLKQCYVADDGWVFVSADYAQIELRLFAELAGGSLLEAFLDGADLHQRTADALSLDRDQGKTFNFGFLIYGGGPRKAAREFGWDEDEAQERLAAVAAEYPEAAAFRERVIKVVEQRGPIPYVQTKTGRRRLVPELQPLAWQRYDLAGYHKKAKYLAGQYGIDINNTRRINGAIRNSGERIAVNTIIQGSAADLAKVAMVDYANSTPRQEARLVTMVHDEILTTALKYQSEKYADILQVCMQDAGPRLGYKVPIIAEPAIGKSWFDVH
jgi:DNA polymerase-1